MRRRVLLLVLIVTVLGGANGHERKVDPTYLHHFVPTLQPKAADISTGSCQYTPVFGAGDPDSVPSIMQGVARFGEITLAIRGTCQETSYPAEEQAYVVLDGNGQLQYAGQKHPVKPHDFFYVPAGVRHKLSNGGGTPLHAFVMGFKVEPNTRPPARLMLANYDEIKKQILSSHPDSVVYQLMMGSVKSERDKLAAAHLLTSLYVMEFKPGGTNFPHHHDSEEEIYYLLDGHGEMVAGSGTNGVEGRHPAKPGDAYFFRENCTVGFYNSSDGVAHILAVRSVYQRPDYPRYVK